MYIHSKPVAAFYKLAVGALALFLEWYVLSQYGWTALRFFSTWVLFLAAIYYLSSALYLAVSHERVSGENPCPMLEGMIIMAFCLIGGATIAAQTKHFTLPEFMTWLQVLIAGVLPVLTLLDWVLFVKKGRFKIMAPFYWLALPACYAATIIFTAELLPSNTSYLYPLAMLNYQEFGLWKMFLMMLMITIIYLVVGYAWFVIDYALSGNLAKQIVMLHIRTVDTDATAEDDTTENADQSEATISETTTSPDQDTALAEDADPETEIDTAAEEALEELKEFTNDKSVEDEDKSEADSAKAVEVETIDVIKPSSNRNTNKTNSPKTKPTNLEYKEKFAKTGKATDIEVIRARVNGNKKSSYNNSKRNNSNNFHNSRKKKSKKRR